MDNQNTLTICPFPSPEYRGRFPWRVGGRRLPGNSWWGNIWFPCLLVLAYRLYIDKQQIICLKSCTWNFTCTIYNNMALQHVLCLKRGFLMKSSQWDRLLNNEKDVEIFKSFVFNLNWFMTLLITITMKQTLSVNSHVKLRTFNNQCYVYTCVLDFSHLSINSGKEIKTLLYQWMIITEHFLT